MAQADQAVPGTLAVLGKPGIASPAADEPRDGEPIKAAELF